MNSKDLMSLGILTPNTVQPNEELIKTFKWLLEVERIFLIQVYLLEDGVTKQQIKEFQKIHKFNLKRVLGTSLTQWEYNNRGVPTFVKLTWKGTEIAEYLLKKAQQENKSKQGV